jgi:hypothetical protein
MKVYLVFKYDGIDEQVVTAFTNKEKAKAFIDNKNNTTRLQWYHQEVEVEG